MAASILGRAATVRPEPASELIGRWEGKLKGAMRRR
jgi:hypothetical protein